MVSQKHSCRRFNRRGVTCPFLALERPQMETEEGDVLWKPGPFVTKWDPHVTPAWINIQQGLLSELVARADMVEVVEEAEAPGEFIPTPQEQGGAKQVTEFNQVNQEGFLFDIPEVEIPWSQPDRFIEQFVKPEAIEVSRELRGGLARVIELAQQWAVMRAIGMASSEPLDAVSSPELGMERVGETLYAEALRRVGDTLTQDDAAAADVGEKPQWYWAGLAAATIALFSRAMQDTSSRVVPFTGRGIGGRSTPSVAPARGGGGGGNFVNVAEIMQQKTNVVNRSAPSRPRRMAVSPEVMAEAMATEVIEIPGEWQSLGAGSNIHIL